MKRICTFALCTLALCSASAQKATVDQAAKLSGKTDQIAQARQLISQAMSDPETSKDARTYFVAGKLEFDAYDAAFKKQMINPNDQSVDQLAMSDQLINGYNAFMKALPLDSVPNAKGEVKPKYSKDIASKINGHFNDYFAAGGTYYGEKKYYPEAYNAFMIYGSLPSMSFADKAVKATPDTVVNTAFFNAGISAYAGNQLEAAAAAFKCARKNGTDNDQNYIYEIACWQYVAANDSNKVMLAKSEIQEIATDGFNRFGVSQPLFINNLVNSYVIDGEMDKALNLVSSQIEKNPDNAGLVGLRAFIYDRMQKDDESVADYKKAADMSGVDFETLKNACKKIYKVGAQKWNEIENNPGERQNIKTNYFEYAKKLSEKAKAMNGNDSELEYIIENIDYALETYFN